MMRIKIFENTRKVAKGQIDPIRRASGELRDLGYSFVENNPDLLLVQTTLFRSEGVRGLIERYKAPVVLLDDAASTGTQKFRYLHMEGVEGYIKKQLLRKRELYLFKYPRKRYHYYLLGKLTGETEEPKGDNKIDEEILSKVFLGWNLGLAERRGIDPSGAAVGNKNRPIDVHFSIKSKHVSKKERDNLGKVDNPYTVHRTICVDELRRIVEKRNLTVSGKCAGDKYLDLMTKSRVCISPYGLGEICWRDFEAIWAGALLIKPSMDYIETWPDIYRPWETYIPCHLSWSNLEDTLVEVLDNYKRYRDMPRVAFACLKKHWNNEVFAKRFDSVIKKAVGR